MGLVLALTGCTLFGPDALEDSHLRYNDSMQRTSDEQLLLNLVRLRYTDSPLFLEVNNITAQFTFNRGAAAGANILEGGGDRYDLDLDLEYEERPTITYSPLQGDEFMQRLLTPISLNSFELLYQSGWPLGRLLRVTVQDLNGVPNAPIASGPNAEQAPKYREFLRVADTLERLDRGHKVELIYTTERTRGPAPDEMTEVRIPALTLHPQAAESSAMEELRSLLGLASGQKTFPLIEGPGRVQEESIRVETRSILGILFYLSRAVEVPAADLERGVASQLSTPDGGPFDWDAVLGDLMEIRAQEKPPRDAYTAVRYRGHWFYLADADLRSKATFTLLVQLFALQSGEPGRGEGPVLTLPIGG